MAKQYGLTVPNKQKQPSVISRPSIFDSDSDSGSENAKPTGLNQSLKRQDRIVQSKAVEEDPTVYQYDEVYDDIEKKRNDSKLARKDLDRKPKYIVKLLAAADRRKRENERRIERQVQKERETEGDEFKDKESFVTSAYRQKLEEIKKLDEEEKREEYLEAIGDVRKQGNLDGFYRHLYDQKVLAEEKINDKETSKSDEKEIKSEPVAADEPKSPETKKRKYRCRKNSEDSDNETNQRQPTQHLPSNLDADSDFSIDSSDSEDPDPEHKKQSETTITRQVNTVSTPASNSTSSETAVVKVKEEKVEEPVQKEEEEVVQPKSPQRQPKIDIWKKRTVGDVFDDALRKYFERKALREAGQYVRPCL